MPLIELVTRIAAPPEVAFDLARSIDLHVDPTASTGERAVGGVTSGLIGLGESVTFEGTHLGVRQRLTSRVVVYDRPRHFRDSMVRGAFARFDHDHLFEEHEGHTRMIDRFDYTSPWGPIGRLADRLFLEAYLVRLLRQRCDVIRDVAESGDAERYLSP